jgi:effector-binding domain-containing protein
MSLLSTTLRTLQPQHALIIRSRIARNEIAATIGQSLGRIVPYALGAGATLAGRPFARYPEFGPGLLTIEVGMPVTKCVAGKDDIEAFDLPGGRCAIGLHGGPYTQLAGSFAALERWIASQSLTVSGPAWEVYVNDPAEFPDEADWRTEIYLPVR